MLDRHAIIEDRDFWDRLEYAACAWLADSGEKRFWIDGFIPETAKNTRRGADVEGIVWVGEGSRKQHELRFIASVPQKLLQRWAQFHIDDITIDEARKEVTISLSPPSSPNQSLQPTAGRSDV
ncbi:MAG: hypothetical protein H0W34_09670 [Pyrinomonadaceae bacterium]|nr:hypothetical protein [Chthoniobacterales bacterium]MBA3572224.1 hypothetical protein [Pyrinomonadaceae bacterium]